jgi:hypothetical protein
LLFNSFRASLKSNLLTHSQLPILFSFEFQWKRAREKEVRGGREGVDAMRRGGGKEREMDEKPLEMLTTAEV